MRLVRLNNAAEIIRACYTEDLSFCLLNGNSPQVWTAIDNCVAAELSKIIGTVVAFRVEADDADLIGFALIDFVPIRVIVDTFIRPVMRPFTVPFTAAVTEVKNNMLPPVL